MGGVGGHYAKWNKSWSHLYMEAENKLKIKKFTDTDQVD